MVQDNGLRNIKLIVEYDGTRYHGWQIQKGKRTVQQELAKAVRKLTGKKVTLHGASRTDSGVHASGQVANFRTPSTLAIERLSHALNSHLPKDITIKSAKEATPAFHAQFDAASKTYRYTILNRETPSAMMRDYYYLVRTPLDVGAMRRASQCLIGEKDFRAFVTQNRAKENTVRRIEDIRIQKDGDFIHFWITGNGFLYNMVRNIVGTLVWVGLRKFSIDDVKRIIKSRDRRKAGPNLPARGLCLIEVCYDKKN